MKDKGLIVFLILSTCLFEGRNQQFTGETEDSWTSEESEGNLSEEFTQNSKGEDRKYVCAQRERHNTHRKFPWPQEFKPGTFMV